MRVFKLFETIRAPTVTACSLHQFLSLHKKKMGGFRSNITRTKTAARLYHSTELPRHTPTTNKQHKTIKILAHVHKQQLA